jgi:hypothetical protein
MGLLLSGLAYAGSFTWNFDQGSDSVTNLVMAGNRADSGLVYQSYDGRGNASTSGYLQLTDGFERGANCAIVFPDIDNGAPVKAFKLTAYLRIGNGTERPADGFSVSFCRENDPALTNLLNGTFTGFAGGDSLEAARNSAGAGNAEAGTKTGVSVSFDAWEGNWLPDVDARNAGNSNDKEGVSVRVDDKTLTQVAKPVRNGACDNVDSMQTGPYDSANPGAHTGLCWAPLVVELDANKQVTVTWKGATVLDHYQLSNYSPHRGRIVLATRGGDAYQNVHVDDITLSTTPASEPTLDSIGASGLNGFTFTVSDNGQSVVTNISSVKLDGVDVTAKVTSAKSGAATTATYAQTDRFASGSQHVVDITVNTALGQTLSYTGMTFTAPSYFVMPVAYRLDPAAVSTPGFKINVYETTAGNPNTTVWTEEQILGLRGANLADATVANGVWTGPIDFDNGQSAGNFQNNTPFSSVGLGVNPEKGNTDNIAMEFFSYVKFPAAGEYIMAVNSDDGFLLTTARNAQDRLGEKIFEYSGGRGVGTGPGAGTTYRVLVDQPGVYPVRLLFENGGGGAGVEWYTIKGDTMTLINDSSAPESLVAYQNSSAAGAYVKSINPVRDAAGVAPSANLRIELADGVKTVVKDSIVLKINGAAQTPTVTQAAGTTTIVQAAPALGWGSNVTVQVELAFTDNANANYSYKSQFSVLPYSVGTATGGVPLGSQDATKPGFTLNLWQLDNQSTTPVNLPNRIHVAEQVLAGLWGANVATAANPTDLTGVVNFNVNQPGNNGNFGEDQPFPGIPGSTTARPTEDFACEFTTWVEFPKAGLYVFGFNSDDGFATKLGIERPTQIGQVVVNSGPQAGKKLATALCSNRSDAPGTQPMAPITGKVVVALGTTGEPQEGCGTEGFSNAAQIAGNIAIVRRGTCDFIDKVRNASQAGALAVIIVNNRPDANPADGWYPTEMGGGPPMYPIPAVMIAKADGDALINALSAGEVNVTVNPMDMSGVVGFADVGRGSTDTLYAVNIATPGLYPLRTVYWQGGGGGDCEWFTVNPDGSKVLLNSTSASALKTYRAVKAVERPTLAVSKAADKVTITFTGTLQSSATVDGAYTDVAGASSPYTVTTSDAAKFFRARK